jgi:hypothetical protein
VVPHGDDDVTAVLHEHGLVVVSDLDRPAGGRRSRITAQPAQRVLDRQPGPTTMAPFRRQRPPDHTGLAATGRAESTGHFTDGSRRRPI